MVERVLGVRERSYAGVDRERAAMSLGGLRALIVCAGVGIVVYAIVVAVIVEWLGWPW